MVRINVFVHLSTREGIYISSNFRMQVPSASLESTQNVSPVILHSNGTYTMIVVSALSRIMNECDCCVSSWAGKIKRLTVDG